MTTKQLYNYYLKSSGVSTDSRKIKKNSIFFALKGDQFNGNDFANEALKMGASFAIVDEQIPNADSKIILVDDVLQSLQNLANHHRNQLNCPVLGITGSNGKTTTKELISAVLSKIFRVCSTQGNLNNHIGVPLTILSADINTEFLIVEMGANHIGEIKQLAEIANINYGLITNIGKAHLEGFGSFQGVISAKKELYDFIEQKNGTIFVNKNDQLLSSFVEKIPKIEYDDEIHISQSAFAAVEFNTTTIQSKLIGNYNCSNIKAACAIGAYFGVDLSDIKKAIEDYTPQNNRSQFVITKHQNSLILDCYNANPSSMFEAIKSLEDILHDKKILILGDMLELGNDSTIEHQKIIDFIIHKKMNAILIGHEFGQCKHPFKQFKNIDDCINWIHKQPIKNALILLKGSRGIRIEQLKAFL